MGPSQTTKCGRYGLTPADFDYSPSTIRKSVKRSLERLGTTYLDAVYLHDVEMVAEEVMPRRDGDHSGALGESREAYGLAVGQEGKVWGEGDRKVLEAYGELKRIKQEGLVKNIGITGNHLIQSPLTATENYCRISAANAVEAGVVDSGDTRTGRRDYVLLPPYDPERHIRILREGAHGSSGCGAALDCFTAVHGFVNSEPTGMESSPRKTKIGVLRGRGRLFRLAWRVTEYRSGFCLSEC